MRKKQPGNLGKEREKKEKRTSVSRALSWLSGSTLSRQTRKLFRSHNDLNTLSQTEHGEQEEDDENWVYEPQHYIAVSNLDEESKWTVHYTAPWHQQENVFLPTSRSACVEELHRQAKVNLKTALRECDKLRKDGFRSSQYYSQGPTFSGSAHSQSSQQEDEEEDDIDDKSAPSTAEEEKLSNTMSTNSPVQGEGAEVDGQAPRLKPMPLPTPEEKMRQQAQAILTDIVPIDVTAAKGRGGELRPQSMFIPGHYSTLGRSASVSSTLKRSETKDSGCQTEEVKIVPPSVRRIRAQRGQGIAAQMSGMSTSTNNISTVPDGRSLGSPVHVMAPRLNGDAQRFHSLPRGARVSLSAEPLYSSTPFRAEDSTATAPRQIGKLQVDETVVHLRNAPRISTSVRPKSQEVRGSQGEWGTGTGPACVVSPHAGYSTSLIPNATLSCSAEVIALHAVSSPGRQLLSRSLRTASSVGGESATSMATSAETEEADMQETGQSDSSLHSHSTIAAGTASPEEHWIYDTPENVLPRRTLSSSCSTPVNHLYNSLERSSKTTDSSSLYSMDNDGYYTSMHLDSGLRPKTNRISDRTTRHSMYECIGQPGDRNSIYSDRSLSRSISLRKSKKPPLPPARTDSLQRKPKNKSGAPNGSNGSVLNETLIATLQQSLQNGLKGKGSLTSSSQSPCSDYEDPWMLRSRSQSSVSAGSSGVSTVGVANVYSICHVTPSHSETSSLRSDYAESWGYYMDYPHIHGDQAQSLTRTNSVSSGGHPGRMTNGQGIHSGMQTNLPPTQSDMSAKPQVNTSSPERVHRLTSPSSGYSSQSNTPTAGTPVPSFMRSMSPSGCKPKPRVPERKSSLLSSVSISSSSTSLSSNTSDSVRNNIPPPAPPLHNSSTSLSPLTPEHFPPPLPPPSLLCTTAQSFSPTSAPALPTTPQQEAPMSTISINSSPEFPPPPPPEMLNDHDMQFNASFSPPHHPPPPPPPLSFAPTLQPPLKPSVPSAASLKGIKDSLKPVNSERRPASIHSEELGKSAMPLITAFALQSVQLRPVKRAENSMVDGSKAHEVEASQISTKPWTKDKSDHSSIMPLMSCSVPENGTLIAPSLDHKINKDNNMSETSLDKNKYEKDMPSHFLSSAPTHNAIVKAEEGELEMEEGVQAEASQPATPKKPPVISKKPKFPIISEAAPECSAEEKHTLVIEVSELPGLQTEVANGTTEQESLHLTVVENKNDNTESSISSTENNKSESCVIQKATFETMHSSEGEREEDEIEDEDEDSSATADSVSFKDDENGEVFESGAADSPQTLSINGDVFQEMVTPTRPRTTEDLFAAIHRSKRKVLGRKESEEERLRGPSSPPATPTGPSPGFTSSLPRQSSFIQRNLRKSATSSDTFKALLLKKGSRSEGSFRMSATEMLRTTDPRFQRTRSLDSPIDLSFTEGLDSPCASPGRNKRVPDDWARSESLLPRYSLGSPSSPSSMLGPKYGRSRTPPSAASSKYNARSRILSSPMTVICERDGELTESTEGLDEPCPISPLVTSPARSKDSNGTLCEEECS